MSNKKSFRILLLAALAFAAFLVLTLLVIHLDRRPIGPQDSRVGLAALNGAVRDLIGHRPWLYRLTDLLSVIPLAAVLLLALLGLSEAVGRRSLLRVEARLLLLGGFYFVVATFFLFFEYFAVNSRPVLIEGVLETSYPSSTALLALTVLPTAISEVRHRMRGRILCGTLTTALTLLCLVLLVGRILSGVHWMTDILGGVLLGTALTLTHAGILSVLTERK